VPRPVLLPDSNVWIYLVNHGGVETLYKESKRLGVAVAACPAVGYEFLRADEPRTKKRRMQALCRTAWKRLMPEVFKEAEEARRAIDRLRPQWIDPHPSLGVWHVHKKDWESAFWYRARTDPEEVAKRIRDLEGSRIELARAEATFNRGQARRANVSFDNVTFDVQATPGGQTPGWWDGRPFEPWRAQFAERLLRDLERPGSASYDWLAPWLGEVTIDDKDWYRLWLREVTKDEMPLAWLRWAFAHVQATRKTSNGAPVDNQIATYLPECDVFATADRIFVECVDKVRPHSPVTLGRAARVPANDDAVDAVVEVLNEMAG
jgi:hypothetical protein